MPWLFLLLALAALGLAWYTASVLLMVACLVVALGLLLAFALALHARRATG
mgnify:CR=1 FL=1